MEIINKKKIDTFPIVSLVWHCGACDKDIPFLPKKTGSGWCICPNCGTAYDWNDMDIADGEKVQMLIDHIGAKYMEN